MPWQQSVEPDFEEPWAQKCVEIPEAYLEDLNEIRLPCNFEPGKCKKGKNCPNLHLWDPNHVKRVPCLSVAVTNEGEMVSSVRYPNKMVEDQFDRVFAQQGVERRTQKLGQVCIL